MIYVDALFDWPASAVKNAQAKRLTQKHGQWCHMISDQADDEELLKFAARLGLKFAWGQELNTPKAHFDLVPTRRAAAVRMGAVEVSGRDLNDLIRLKCQRAGKPVFYRGYGKPASPLALQAEFFLNSTDQPKERTSNADQD